jgi:hypothetical protein
MSVSQSDRTPTSGKFSTPPSIFSGLRRLHRSFSSVSNTSRSLSANIPPVPITPYHERLPASDEKPLPCIPQFPVSATTSSRAEEAPQRFEPLVEVTAGLARCSSISSTRPLDREARLAEDVAGSRTHSLISKRSTYFSARSRASWTLEGRDDDHEDEHVGALSRTDEEKCERHDSGVFVEDDNRSSPLQSADICEVMSR